MRKCYFCRGEIIKEKIQHIHQWGDKIVLFKAIPAEVCKQCGEVYFTPDVVEMMDNLTIQAEKTKESIRVPVIPFPELVEV